MMEKSHVTEGDSSHFAQARKRATHMFGMMV